jgi:hypothetical protein
LTKPVFEFGQLPIRDINAGSLEPLRLFDDFLNVPRRPTRASARPEQALSDEGQRVH